MLPARLQIVLVIAVIIYFIMMCVFLKNKALSLKYTLLWLFAGCVLGVLVAFPQLLTFINGLIGIQGNMNGLFIWAIAFVVCILLSLTSIVSRQNNKIRQLTQTIARMEKRLRDLEEARDIDAKSET